MFVNNRSWQPIRPLIPALLALLALWPPTPSYADAAPRWTDAQLVGFSDVIVRGRVADVSVGRDEIAGAIFTYVTIDVADVVKGSVPGRQIVLKQLGGRLGSTALEIAGQATFSPGENVLVFLEVRPRDRTLTTTALWQGKFTIRPGASDGGTATRQDPGGHARGVFGDQSRSLAPWIASLRRQASEMSATTADAIEFTPTGKTTATPDGGSAGVASASWRDASLQRQAVRVDSVSPGQPQLSGGGEQELRRAADFWSATGVTTLATGGLQPSGCFTARAPDGRISVGIDACDELSPRGGTLAVSGGWVEYSTDAAGLAAARFLGAGVMTNRGETAARWLARSSCFEQLLKHELGHALGLIDGPDGSGVMAPSLNCDSGSVDDGARPIFVPLTPGASRIDGVDPRGARYDSVACTVGCRITANDAVTTIAGPTNLTYTLTGSTLTLTWTAPAGLDVVDYNIHAGSAPDGFDVANFSTGSTATTLSATVGGNAVFYVRVRAYIRFAGITDPSNEVVVVIGNAASPPGPPTDLTGSVAGTTVTLAWNPPGTGPVSSYVVQAGASPGTAELANFSTGSSATSFSAAGVGPGTYYVRVRAFNASGTSTPSNEVVLTLVPDVCVAPAAPANLVATLAGSNVMLTWTAGGAAASYLLEVGSRPGQVDLVDRDLLSADTTLSASDVAVGTYFVRLRSVNACGQSAPSNEALIIIR